MPHQCVRCNHVYQDGANEIIKGCSCAGRLFFYIKKNQIEESKEIISNLTVEEKKQIETDVKEMVGEQEDDQPVILDLESIRVLKPGKYELDLVHLFKKDPLIFKLEEGKYIIDLPQIFKEEREKIKK